MPDDNDEFLTIYEFDETPEKMFIDRTELRADDHEAYIEEQGEIEDSKDQAEGIRKPAWRNSMALMKLKKQINSAYPNRKKTSDGHIGNNAHCPHAGHTGSSDHCLNITDGKYKVVVAMDITHDPKHCDINAVVKSIRGSRDSRIKYIIWNKRICNHKALDGKPAWAWRPYSGKNPHTKHAHFSAKKKKKYYDDISHWSIFPSVNVS